VSRSKLIYLVGFMGCGKSEVGPRVAAELGWEFEDTDRMVEAIEGKTVEAIFADSGEPRFREKERKALDLVSRRAELVVATGGGLFLDRSARHTMKGGGATV
jgi:shikimate kinase